MVRGVSMDPFLSRMHLSRISDPSIPGLVTIVLNTYFIDMMMSWLWFYRLPSFVWNVRKSIEYN